MRKDAVFVPLSGRDRRWERQRRRSLLVFLLAVLGVTSCSRDVAPVPESQYRATLVGEWLGTVGEMKESIGFRADGSFTSKVRPTGFISNTLGQGTTGTIGGTWELKGKVITLTVTTAENETVLNKRTTSAIESFTPNELVVKSDNGETSKFFRGA